ncbi:hypothetical protein GCM10020370_36110 [Paenibacillus hodogayensis]
MEILAFGEVNKDITGAPLRSFIHVRDDIGIANHDIVSITAAIALHPNNLFHLIETKELISRVRNFIIRQSVYQITQ